MQTTKTSLELDDKEINHLKKLLSRNWFYKGGDLFLQYHEQSELWMKLDDFQNQNKELED